MENFLTQIHEMRRKIDSRINPQSEEFQGISKLVEQFKKENERLGQKVMERDEQILRINELINITDSQYSDRHTIESLRN